MQTTAWQLHIPANTGPNDVLRMAGASAQGEDLHVHLTVTSHPLVRRRNLNLYVDLAISPGEAALGGTVPCVLPHRTLDVAVPRGTQAGALIVLPGEGLRGRGARGDLHLSVDIETPAVTDAAAQTAWQALRAWEQGHPEAFALRRAQARAMQG